MTVRIFGGVSLGLVEAWQGQQRWADAIACLERLRRLEPDDVVVKLSLAELLLEASPGYRGVYQKVVRLAEGVKNETLVHTALLFYKSESSARTRAAGCGAGYPDRCSAPKERPFRGSFGSHSVRTDPGL